jgi:hypothetical protein
VRKAGAFAETHGPIPRHCDGIEALCADPAVGDRLIDACYALPAAGTWEQVRDR